MELTWEQKLQAMQSLSPFGTNLVMRKPGNWYVHHDRVNRKEGGCLSGGLQNGETPEEAVRQCWEWMIDPKYYMVVGYTDDRKAVRWNGFMWETVNENP